MNFIKIHYMSNTSLVFMLAIVATMSVVTSVNILPDANASVACSSTEISVDGNCIPYAISGGMVTGATINTYDNSIIINLGANGDGILIVTPSESTLQGIFMVLVDGEEWDDVEINDNKVTVMFLAGAEEIEVIGTSLGCASNEVSADGNCIPYNISGGMVTGATINTNDNSIIISLDAHDDGILIVTPSESTQEGIFMVLVDGEEWDDVAINGNEVTVMFPAGAEEIEVIGTFVVPEFGTIAAMILVVAIISIIAISSKSRLSIIPRY